MSDDVVGEENLKEYLLLFRSAFEFTRFFFISKSRDGFEGSKDAMFEIKIAETESNFVART